METLTNPETGEVVQASRNTAKALRDEGWEDQAGADNAPVGDPEELEETDAATDEVGPESAEDEAPAKSATRGEWDEYARSHGIDPEEYSSKDDLIEAVEAL